jgi:hypothetical protein
MGGALALAGCAAPPSVYQSFHLESGIGYRDVRLDAGRYSVAYADRNQDTADAYLEMRAAEICRDAGFAYFAFEKRGRERFLRTENDLARPEYQRTRGAGIPVLDDLLPDVRPKSMVTTYLAWGEVRLLTAEQAQVRTDAIAVQALLRAPPARPGAS